MALKEVFLDAYLWTVLFYNMKRHRQEYGMAVIQFLFSYFGGSIAGTACNTYGRDKECRNDKRKISP